MIYNRNSLENLKELYSSVHTTKKDQFLSEGTEVEEGYKEIDRDKENRMYRRAGNLARQSLSSKGEKKINSAKKSAKIVSAITRQKEKERFERIGKDPKHQNNYNEAFVDPERGEAPSGRTPLENVSDHPKASVRKKAIKGMRNQMEKEYGGKWRSRSNDPVKEEIEYTNNYRENFYDVVCEYIISEGFASDVDGANQVILKLEDQLMLDIYEAKMTAAEKKKEGKLKTKYDDSGMKASMVKQYGAEKGKQVYFATIRKQAMEEVEIDEATAMAKRGYDETKLRKRAGGGEAADRATSLENRPTYGDKNKEAQRSRYARSQRGDFRSTASSNPGLHGYAHKSDDPKVKAKQAARGAQRGALTPNEKKQLNMGEAVYGGGKKKEEPKDDRYVITNADKKANTKAYQAYKAGNTKLYRAADHLKENQLLDERRKEDKVAGTPRKPRDKAFEFVAKSMGSGRLGVQPRGQKKEPGKKPPVAGEYGAPKSPAQKVAMRRASAKKSQDNMSSRFD
jgi:hypothetical protein